MGRVSLPLSADRDSIWLVTYVSLFTSLLAFFILAMTMVELEGSDVRREHQRFQNSLYQQVVYHRQKMGLDWLEVEETVTLGTRLTLRQQAGEQSPMFALGSDQLSLPWRARLQELSVLLSALELSQPSKNFGRHVRVLHQRGHDIQVQLRVVGHTDNQPINGGRFANNWELSAARALSVARQLQAGTFLPDTQLAIAGLGSFHPLGRADDHDLNRRVEIYLTTRLLHSVPVVP